MSMAFHILNRMVGGYKMKNKEQGFKMNAKLLVAAKILNLQPYQL